MTVAESRILKTELLLGFLEAMPQRCFPKKVVVKMFAKFTRKVILQSLFCNEIARPVILFENTPTQLFSCKFCEMF